MSEGILTIDDLLNRNAQLGSAQQDLAAQKVKSEKLKARNQKSKIKNLKSDIAPLQFRDIPTSLEQPRSDNIPDTRYQMPNTNYQIPDTNEQQEAGQSLREQVLAAKQEEAKKKAAKEKTAEQTGAQAGAEGAGKKFGTSMLLKMSWLNLIDTFGLTLIYINIHVFLRWVLGEKFSCKLGEEWAPSNLKTVAGGAEQAAGKMAGTTEVMLLICLDIFLVILILIIVGFFAVVYQFLYHTWTGWGIRVITPGI